MTPNPPSDTPTPRRSFKAEFKAWLASKAGKPVRPFPGQSPTPLAPVAPAISQEQFTDAQRPVTQQREIRTRQLMDRVCAVNNANVTRNYGTHTTHEASRVPVEPLTAEEMADFDRLLTTVRPLDTPGARKSVFAEPRRTPEEYALHARMVADRVGITAAHQGVPVRNTAATYRSRLNPPTPTPLQAAAQRRHERDEHMRSSYVPPPESCAPYVPDLFAAACPAPSYEPPAPAPSYDSGGGGDFGGGGASSSWD